MTDEITDEIVKSALRNIALTGDGLVLYRYLQRELMGVPTTTEVGALQQHAGTRKFVAKLMGLMAQGMAERASEHGRHDPSDRPVVFVVPDKPVNARGVKSAREWLAESEPLAVDTR